ncbi:hypothetical protein CAP36_01950 [Chitinophagaceae bacterium IBVUCB2]|nr:hypothetical protein CAP36_01950 [Chitinophagaceae bacterium IBVUCB2]
MTTKNDLFYSRLPVNEIPLSDLLTEEHLFYNIPDDWHVLITDVKNSTQAAMDGRHQTVNLVATGSIVAALNVANKNNILVPFFFGGDGATFIIPPSLLESTLNVLHQHRENTQKNFDLTLRVGHVPVADVYNEKSELKVSKLKTSQRFTIPVILGDGLTFAEKKIKSTAELPGSDIYLQELDMSGMHCRWDKIKPPATNFEIISLLIIAGKGIRQSEVFRDVMMAIEKIYGNSVNRKPISIDKLRMKATFEKVAAEMRTRLGGFSMIYLVKTWFTSLLGKAYFKTKKGKEYLYKLVDMSDTLVIDGKINTVISGTANQREELETVLIQMEQEKKIVYGLHVSSESVMSCYVRNMDDQHIHFVDGADGGYTKAAGILKKKIATLKELEQ